MPFQRDYYAILDVSPNASQDELQRAFRRKVHAVHPDNGGSPRRLAIVTQAWEVLGDPARRRDYDARQRGRAAKAKTTATRTPPPNPKKLPTWGRVLGSLVGRALHALTPNTPRTARPRQPKVIRCAKCGQKLQLKPAAGGRARCPKCKTLCRA